MDGCLPSITINTYHFVFTGKQEADETLRIGSKKSRNVNRRHIAKKFSLVPFMLNHSLFMNKVIGIIDVDNQQFVSYHMGSLGKLLSMMKAMKTVRAVNPVDLTGDN